MVVGLVHHSRDGIGRDCTAAAIHETVGVGGRDDAVDLVGLHEEVESAVKDGEVRIVGEVL